MDNLITRKEYEEMTEEKHTLDKWKEIEDDEAKTKEKLNRNFAIFVWLSAIFAFIIFMLNIFF